MAPLSAYFTFGFFLKGFTSIISMTTADDDSPVAPPAGVQDNSFASLPARVGAVVAPL